MSTWSTIAHRILGMNARNLQFIRPYNSRRAVMLARNKLETKQCLAAAGLPSAQLYGIIHNRQELFDFNWDSLPTSFVLKPNFGLGGNGILIIYGKTKTGQWISGDDHNYTREDLALRVSNILDGNYSFSNIPDIAYFEQRLRLSEEFKHISYKGIPDIRIIVFNSVPVMAMLRLPTKTSDGKANLHSGGIGVGIDLASGVTTFATAANGQLQQRHPDYNTPLGGITIPQWDTILLISIKAQQAVGLGYVGVDIVLDKELGPVILEVNGHPGLGIQNANWLPLRDRLERVAGLTITSPTKGLNVCKELFGHSGTSADSLPVVGVYENVTVYPLHSQSINMRARLDTGLTSTTITKDLAQRLGYQAVLRALADVVLPSNVSLSSVSQVEADYREQLLGIHPDIVDVVAVRTGTSYSLRPKVPLKFTLANRHITTATAIALDNKLSYPLIIGRSDLQGFLINPAKK
ncbi:MAG: hypothetical protein HYV33_06100 [Candidatus Kerfeldbacteria bacterium]|nr:hypothetical protein [Candidatus Kerfeldbacteria bacterium]